MCFFYYYIKETKMFNEKKFKKLNFFGLNYSKLSINSLKINNLLSIFNIIFCQIFYLKFDSKY